MANKTLLITLLSFGLLLSAAPGRSLADSSAETVRAIEPDPSGLIAHYEFEGFAVDTSGSQPPANGALFGNPAYVDGVFGRGIALDGEDDYVDCGNQSTFNLTGQLTVTAWIKVDKFDKMYQTIIAKGDDSWRLARAGKSNRIEFSCNGTAANKWNGTGEVPWAVSGTTDVNDGKWHHIAGVFDGSGLYLYIDGILESAKGAAKPIDISSHNVFIGANAQVPGRQWNGLIDDVQIYNYALSQAEIVSLFGKSEINLPEPVPATLYNISKRYDGLKKREEAEGVCRIILQKYPDSPFAANAQIYITKRDILSLLQSKKYTEAQEEIDNLIANFNDNPDTAEALYAIAQAYSSPRKFKEAESVYTQLIELFPDSSHAKEALFRAPKIHIFYLIQSGDYNDANVAIDTFTSDFTKHPATPGILYWFAKEYEASKAYRQARSMYQRVAWLYPDSIHAAKAWVGFYKMDALSFIDSGDETTVEQIIDNLIADFNDHPDLPDTIFELGHKYYTKARLNVRDGFVEQATEYYQKAITQWERIINIWPRCSYAPRAYYCSAVVYSQELGEYLKGISYYQQIAYDWPDYQYASHAQFLVGKNYEILRDSGSVTESEANPKIEQAYKSVIEKYPDSKYTSQAALKLGRLNLVRKEWSEAATHLEFFRQKSSQQRDQVLLDLGFAYEKIGNLDEALQLYTEFIEKADPADPRLQSLIAKLERLQGENK